MNYLVVMERSTPPFKATFGPFPSRATAQSWAERYISTHNGVIEYRIERLIKPEED